MGKRTLDKKLSKGELLHLVKQVEARFYSQNDTTLKFTGTKGSDIYRLLQKDIRNVSDITISEATLRDIMTLKHSGSFRPDIYEALVQYFRTHDFTSTSTIDGMQKIFWGVNQGLEAGAYIDSIDGEFIPWDQLKHELEKIVISGCPRVIPVGAKVRKDSFYGKEDWLVNIVNEHNEAIGSVWIGSDPYKNWYQDGLVRTGRSISDNEWEVYQIFGRCSDGSYKIIWSFV